MSRIKRLEVTDADVQSITIRHRWRPSFKADAVSQIGDVSLPRRAMIFVVQPLPNVVVVVCAVALP